MAKNQSGCFLLKHSIEKNMSSICSRIFSNKEHLYAASFWQWLFGIVYCYLQILACHHLQCGFYRAMLCIRGTSHGPVSVCLSVSVTSRCSTKMAKRRITQTTPCDTPGTLVFWCQRSPRNSTGVTPYKGAECMWGGQNRRLSTNNRLYLENGKR